MTQAPARHALFGHPVAHSLSPQIHAMFGRETGIALTYEAIDCRPEDFAAALERFMAEDGTGANVTLPLKEVAFPLCAQVSERARASGVINTLVREGEAWHGDNTDGQGLLRDLRNRQALDLRQRRTLLLGAGGGARGVAPALLDAGIGDLFVVNRDGTRADALVDRLGLPGKVHARYYDDLGELGDFSLIVNATSAARNTGLPKLPMSLVGSRTACVDLSYGEASIPFLSWARAARAHDVVDGLGMLVEQAAESFKLWHGVRPDADPVYAELRQRHDALVTAD
ncbi:shikimate dehydrogenase [Luteimonas vadosa]|uniref:Shikimate dehydrogenase (NADP(+)) n=1 Tax=Luteimonas vadosa TaxID=1165507 RepID=A0ABP9DR40_9GAMM